MVELKGFPELGREGKKGAGGDNGYDSEAELDTAKMVQEANRK